MGRLGERAGLPAQVTSFCLLGASLRGNDDCLALWLDGSEATSYSQGTFKMNRKLLNGHNFSLHQALVASQDLAVSDKNGTSSPKEGLVLLQDRKHPVLFFL